jgi:hypothetical protein
MFKEKDLGIFVNIIYNMLTKMPEKNAEIFSCESCYFVCSKKSNYDKHLLTRKHKTLTKPENVNFGAEILSCHYCHKQYASRVGLWKHEKKCKEIHILSLNVTEIDAKKSKSEKELDNEMITKDMFMELIHDNKEMIKIIKDQQEQIKSMIPKMGNTINNTTNNNNFNLNFFLNEQCKDALNIQDFIQSLKITFEDLYFTKKHGIAEGLSNLMINGLKELDVYKRPIHCTDLKRDIVYIKDHDKWEKDDNKQIIKKTIENVAIKQRNKISEWVELNPDWIETESKQLEYLTLVNKICEPIEYDNKLEKKIMKNISKEVHITDMKKM